MRSILVTTVALVLCASAFSQSGRRIKTQPTPSPTSAPVEEGYSESRSYRPVKIYPPGYVEKVRKEKDDKPDDPAASPEEDVISIESTLVNIPVSIYDKNGLYISGLRKEQFKIFEDGKEQEIAYFGNADKPITVALLIDVSNSTEYKIEDIRQAATAFVNELMPEDSVMVVAFDDSLHILTEPTTDREKIYKAIRRANFGGGTALYDAVEFVLTKRLNKIEGRKAVVLFTDGVDTTSRGASYGENLEDAEESEAVIFPIYFNTFLSNRSGTIGLPPMSNPNGGILFPQPQQRRTGTTAEEYAVGKSYLEAIASYTGGRVYDAGGSRFGLQSTFEAIAEELKRQYNIGYYPSEEGKKGDRKNIKVRVYRPNVIVRARDSYIVGKY
jgi:Ca-activated chloride channel family protein